MTLIKYPAHSNKVKDWFATEQQSQPSLQNALSQHVPKEAVIPCLRQAAMFPQVSQYCALKM